MKEKYIFFTLLVIAIGVLIGSRADRKTKREISAKELVIEKKLRRTMQRKPTLPGKIDMNKIQNLVAFSHYKRMLEKSPFFKIQRKITRGAKGKIEVMPVEEATPIFVYKGKIISGNRLVVVIEQTRSGEVSIVSKGERIDGYKVLDITDTEVILSKRGENIILKTSKRP